MEEKDKDILNEEKLSKNNEDNNGDDEEFLEDLENHELKEEPEYVTREINLDDLYDGAINNTVVIDPVTNNEVLLRNKKPNYTIIGVIVAIIILLVLYYVNNKTDLGRTTKDVEPKTTVSTKKNNVIDVKNGTLTCNYSSKGEAESQTATFVANYENSVITTTNFNFVVITNTDTESAVVSDLKNQYENFFINNASVKGNNISFEKTDKGFTFNVETDYVNSDFNGITINDGQTVLFVKPEKEDTIDSLKEAYTNKGYSCAITNNNDEE